MVSTASEQGRLLWEIDPLVPLGRAGGPAPGRPWRSPQLWVVVAGQALVGLLVVLLFLSQGRRAGPTVGAPPRAGDEEGERLGESLVKDLGALSGGLVDLKGRLTAIEKTLNSRAAPPPPGNKALVEQVEELKAALQKMAPLVVELQKTAGKLEKEVVKLSKPPPAPASPNLSGKAVEKVVKDAVEMSVKDTVAREVKGAVETAASRGAERASDKYQEIVERNFGKPLTNLRAEVLQVTQGLAGLTEQFKRESAATEVALVLYHSAKLDANKYLKQVEELAKRVPSKAYPHHHLGVYVASDDRVVKRLLPLAADGKPAGKSPFPFDKLTPAKNSVEQPDKLQFAGVFVREAGKVRRRCVFVVSTGSAPPALDDKGWKGIGVDAVLIDRPGTPRSQVNQQAWQKFCQAHGGLAVTLATREAKKAPDFDLDPEIIKDYLQRLIGPRLTGPR